MNLPANAAILSFEGPDAYSMVGGLGVRVTQMASALADAGIATDLHFVGAPEGEPVERRSPHLRLRRWAQSISRRYPGGVYDGQHEKIGEYASLVPTAVCDEIAGPARERGERVLVIGEDWQIAPAILALDAELRRRGLRDTVTLLWNANNTYGFDTIDWWRLQRAARITAVSKYMKFELTLRGVPAFVIPNGIPKRLVKQYDAAAVRKLRKSFTREHTLLKVGRFDPDKRWLQAVDALAELRRSGADVQMLIRGGREPYRDEVLHRAYEHGLLVAEIRPEGTPAALSDSLRKTNADLIELRSFLADPTLFALYGAADAVVANSGREPFGLVGLEVMALHGIPVCGSTGEDYARPFENAIVCDTDDPGELASYLRRLFEDRHFGDRIRKNGRNTAREYVWPRVLEILSAKLNF